MAKIIHEIEITPSDIVHAACDCIGIGIFMGYYGRLTIGAVLGGVLFGEVMWQTGVKYIDLPFEGSIKMKLGSNTDNLIGEKSGYGFGIFRKMNENKIKMNINEDKNNIVESTIEE